MEYRRFTHVQRLLGDTDAGGAFHKDTWVTLMSAHSANQGEESGYFSEVSDHAKDAAWAVWRNHHKVSLRRVSGSTQLLPNDAHERVDAMQDLLFDMNSKRQYTHILCGDEVSVCYEQSYPTTYATKGSQRVKLNGTNQEKQAVTVWLSSVWSVENGTVHKIRPHVLVKAADGSRMRSIV